MARGSIFRCLVCTGSGLGVHKALVRIWMPILIVGAVVESVSIVLKMKAGKSFVPLLNRRLDGAAYAHLERLIEGGHR